MRKQMKYLAAFVLPHACIINVCLFMIFFNIATPFISGFGVDSSGRLYVGENKTINIYQNGKKEEWIELKSSNYEFTVDLDDTIILAYPTTVHLMDTSGNVLESKEDPSAQTYSRIQNSGRTVVTANGDRYKKVGELGWTRIVKNGSEVVYRISIFSFVVKCLLQISAASMLINGMWVIHRIHELNMRG